MLDMLGILVSTIAILFVMVRAATLDQAEPWFEAIDEASSNGPSDGNVPESAPGGRHQASRRFKQSL